MDRELPYLADVARLDRLWLECFLSGAPATRVTWFATPAVTIWQAHRQPGGFDELEPEWREEGALFACLGVPSTPSRSIAPLFCSCSRLAGAPPTAAINHGKD